MQFEPCESPGILPRPVIRQEVRGDFGRSLRTPSAEAKATAAYPNDFMSPLIASRI